MKFRSVLSLLLAIILCCSTLVISASAALTTGDIDGKDGVTAADARLALRASVKLEKLTDEQTKAANVDGKDGVTAADARLILRASVKLENLHSHDYKTETIVKPATCAAEGEKKLTCECGDFVTEKLAKLSHTAVVDKKVEPTCATDGKTEGAHCSVCNAILVEQTKIPATGHIFAKKTIIKEASAEEYGVTAYYCLACPEYESINTCTHAIPSLNVSSHAKCAVSGCQGQFPSFNNLVNALKTPGAGNSFYSFTKTTSIADKPTIKATNWKYSSVKTTMEMLLGSSFEAENIVEYSEFISNRALTKSTFFVKGKTFVSNLNDSEIKSVKTEKMSGVDFVKALPDSYTATASKKVNDLKKIKNSVIGDVYKLTVTLKDETVTLTKFPTSTTPIEKIFIADYNTGLKSSLKTLTSAFDEFPEELASMFKMDASIISGGTVSFYFKADTLKPVAASYTIKMDTVSNMHTYFNSLGVNVNEITTTMTVNTKSTQEHFYFFNNHFTVY